MSRVVITGALGHIGSRLIRDTDFVSGYEEIILIDDLRSQRLNSLFDLPSSGKFSLIEADLRKTDLERVLEKAEAVVHLAALTDAEASAQRPEETLENNLGATEILIQACVATGTRLVFPSTTSVYGAQDGGVSESLTESALNPQSPYAESKILEERAIQSFAGKGLLQATVFRFGTIFGTSPGMRFHTAVNKFCWQARFGLPLTVWRTAMDQLRPYLAIEDSVNSIGLALRSPDRFQGVTNVVTNNFSVKEVVSAIQAFVPDVEVQFVDSPIMNQLSYNVSNQKSVEAGMRYVGDLKDGVRQTLELLGVVAAGPSRVKSSAANGSG